MVLEKNIKITKFFLLCGEIFARQAQKNALLRSNNSIVLVLREHFARKQLCNDILTSAKRQFATYCAPNSAASGGGKLRVGALADQIGSY